MPPPQQPPTERLTVAKMLLSEDVPAPPPCFPSDELWREYLLLVHISGARIVRRQESGRHAGERQLRYVWAIQPLMQCEDCNAEYERRMTACGRCEKALAEADHKPLTETVV